MEEKNMKANDIVINERELLNTKYIIRDLVVSKVFRVQWCCG